MSFNSWGMNGVVMRPTERANSKNITMLDLIKVEKISEL